MFGRHHHLHGTVVLDTVTKHLPSIILLHLDEDLVLEVRLTLTEIHELIQILRGLCPHVACGPQIHALLVVNPAVAHRGLGFNGLL